MLSVPLAGNQKVHISQTNLFVNSVYVLNEFFLRVSLRFEHGYSTVQDISLICKENIKKKLFNNKLRSGE